MITLEPKEQASKLKEVEKLPLKAENLLRIKKLRTNIESIPLTPDRHSVTHYPRFNDAEFNNFSLSPEILSEKLYDSVKMVRDLMNSNKKLKENITEINQQKRIIETENVQLHNDNQDLLERLEVAENYIQKVEGKKQSKEIVDARSEREKLAKKILKLENQKKNSPEANSSKEN